LHWSDYIIANCSVCGNKSILVLLVSGFVGDLYYVIETSKYVIRKPEDFRVIEYFSGFCFISLILTV